MRNQDQIYKEAWLGKIKSFLKRTTKDRPINIVRERMPEFNRQTKELTTGQKALNTSFKDQKSVLPVPNQSSVSMTDRPDYNFRAPNQSSVSITDRPDYNFRAPVEERAKSLGMTGMGPPELLNDMAQAIKGTAQKAKHPIQTTKDVVRGARAPLEEAIQRKLDKGERFTKTMQDFNKDPWGPVKKGQGLMKDAPKSFGELPMNPGLDHFVKHPSMLSEVAQTNPVARTLLQAGKGTAKMVGKVGKAGVKKAKDIAKSQKVKDLIEFNKGIRYPIQPTTVDEAIKNKYARALHTDLTDPSAPAVPLPLNLASQGTADVLNWAKKLIYG